VPVPGDAALGEGYDLDALPVCPFYKVPDSLQVGLLVAWRVLELN
jgi:hypothetical protein